LAALAVAAILGHGAWLRHDVARALEYDEFSERDPDVLEYIREASQARGFYHISIREPLFIFVARMAPVVSGSRPYRAMRMQSVAFGMALIGLVYLVGVGLHGHLVGLGAALPMAINPTLVFQDQRGLREPLYVFLMVALVYVLFLRRDWAPALRYAIVGVTAAALMLVRITGLQIFVILLGVAVLTEKEPWPTRVRRAGVSVALVALLVAPYLYGCARQFHDPFVSINAHAIFWRNVEFGGRPGFPSREELRQNNYLGPPLTAAQYVFGMHSPWEIVVRNVQGYRDIATRLLVADARGWLYFAFGVVGLGMMAVTSRWWFGLATLASVLPVAFVASLGAIDNRFIIPIFPFFFLAAAYGAVAGASSARLATTALLGRRNRSRLVQVAAGSVAFAVVLGAAAWGDGREWRRREYVEDFNDGGRRAARQAERVSGWSGSPDGLALLPGHSGEIVYRFRRWWFTRARVQLWVYQHPGITETAIEVSTDGRHFTPVARNVRYEGDWLDLGDRLGRGALFYLRITAEHLRTAGARDAVLVVDRVRVVQEW
jgi:4-amino-4-deoxy-L-arabinose transferase-like glycosyltransferase